MRARIGGRLIPKRTGLPQGSSLSPVLFLYLMHHYSTKEGKDYSLMSKITAFADDIMIVDNNEDIEKTYRSLKKRFENGV